MLRRVARQEAEALRALYEKHASRVLAVALRVLRSRADAEEVVQETFLEIWRRSPEYDPRRGTPLAWMSTIGRTRAIDRLRSRGARERTLSLVAPPVATTPSPQAAAEAGELEARVQLALKGLPSEQRRVLELAYFEGLSHSEIAKETGDALGTVKTRVRLGMEKLAAVFAEIQESEQGSDQPR
jgi:RNA polymerase sigma-70 factor (ECF subfamily)